MQECQEISGLVQDISHISVSFNGGPYKFTCFLGGGGGGGNARKAIDPRWWCPKGRGYPLCLNFVISKYKTNKQKLSSLIL